jgi:hypothetical protein
MKAGDLEPRCKKSKHQNVMNPEEKNGRFGEWFAWVELPNTSYNKRNQRARAAVSAIEQGYSPEQAAIVARNFKSPGTRPISAQERPAPVRVEAAAREASACGSFASGSLGDSDGYSTFAACFHRDPPLRLAARFQECDVRA